MWAVLLFVGTLIGAGMLAFAAYRATVEIIRHMLGGR